MDQESERISQERHQSPIHFNNDSGSIVDYSIQSGACNVCGRVLDADSEATVDLEMLSLCGDCKFLLLEDLDTPARISRRRQFARRRRTRYSESIENLFSQQFSHMINMARQNLSAPSRHDNHTMDVNVAPRIFQQASSHASPSDSRGRRRVLSDTESDGFDYLDSMYGENESNASFGRYRFSHGESDAVSFSAYGGDSDVSVDGYSFLDTEVVIQPDDGTDLDTDTDIDPMLAGLNQWNSDDQDEEDAEWEDAEEDTTESSVARQTLTGHWSRRYRARISGWRINGGRQTLTRNIMSSLEEVDLPLFGGTSGDYLDARGFEQLLERLAESDNSRRGAPPASRSLLNNLPRLNINEEHVKHDLACAICKDVFVIGTEVNQLPCLHLYHASCIMPWLHARNSCPICRYELPTDDKDYEEGKQGINSMMPISVSHERVGSEYSSSEEPEAVEFEATEFADWIAEREGMNDHQGINNSDRVQGSGRWFFLAAPVVSLVSLVLVLWFSDPQRRRPGSSFNQHTIQNQRGNRSRRWWSLF